jgi:hypothetical protein
MNRSVLFYYQMDRTRDQIEQRLNEIRREEKTLLAELATLDALCNDNVFSTPLGEKARTLVPKNVEEKIALFKELFVARQTVYPKLTNGYAEFAYGGC